jgi:hypothetical protein
VFRNQGSNFIDASNAAIHADLLEKRLYAVYPLGAVGRWYWANCDAAKGVKKVGAATVQVNVILGL